MVAIPTVAAAPDPPPPINLTRGADVYPAPVLVSNISLMDRDVIIPLADLSVIIATADALIPPDGAPPIATDGVLEYPNPSFINVIFEIAPFLRDVNAIAVDPIPTKVSETPYPDS